jgi:hypothetical protein
MVWIILRQCDQFVAENAALGGISIPENDGAAGTSGVSDTLSLRWRERKPCACGSIQAVAAGDDRVGTAPSPIRRRSCLLLIVMPGRVRTAMTNSGRRSGLS